MKRRHLLAVTGGLASLAGCGASEAFARRQFPRIGELYLRNESENQHTLHVIVSRDDSIVYWSSYTLAARSAEKDSANEATVTGMDWMQEPGDWGIGVRVDEQESWKEITLEKSESACKVVNVTYDDEDPRQRELDLYVSTC